MNVDIAKVLGEILAFQIDSLNKDPHDHNVLCRIKIISEIYASFVSQDFSGFRESFEYGYQTGQRDIGVDASPSARYNLNAFGLDFGPESEP